ncbi:MAG: TolC family protein [Gammaproteobacteria bacterium]|nr:TolC family protein [Gammaproteobacteria bacterium]
MSLPKLISLAVEHDPWLDRSRALEHALSSEAIFVGELPDPQVSVTLLNFPTDTFDLAQEPMTQIRFAVTQNFPGGESRALRRRVKVLQGERQVVNQITRKKIIELQVTDLWLSIHLARLTSQLINDDRPLFEQLIEVTNASYRSATRRVSQQDLIRAQLELTKLDHRLLRLKELQESRHKELAEWLPIDYLATPISWQIPVELTVIPVRETDGDRLHQLLSRHPELRSIDHSVAAKRIGLSLAQETNKPDWALNAAYSYRDEDRFGRDLPDFVTLGVTFQLPIFKKNRQNKQIVAAADRVSASESGRLVKLQQLTRRYLKAYATLEILDERLVLYRESLLRQMQALAEASLNAYTTDAGDFADVMRAYIALLNTKIEAQTIKVNRLKVLAEIRYVATNPEYAL